MSQSDQGRRTPEPAKLGTSMSTPDSDQRSSSRGRGRGRARTMSQPAPVGRGRASSSASSSSDIQAQGQYADYVFIEAEKEGFGTPAPAVNQKGHSRTIHVVSRRSESSLSTSPGLTTSSNGNHNISISEEHATLQPSAANDCQEVIIEVSGVTENIDESTLTIYFEDEESGGELDSVKDCKLSQSGYAYVTFHESRVVNNVMAKQEHKLEGAPLNLKRVKKVPEIENESISIILSNIPSNIDKLHIELCVQDVKRVTVSDVVDGTCTVHFPVISSEKLEERIKRMKALPGGKITTEKFYTQNALRITHFDKKRSAEFLKRYFSNKTQSGGGELSSVPTLLEEGNVAIVSFKQPEALKRVLAKNHTKILGNEVCVEIEDSLKKWSLDHDSPVCSNQNVVLQSIDLPLDRYICRAIAQCPNSLDDFGKSMNLTCKVQMDHIVVTPSKNSFSDWQLKFEGFLSKTFGKCEMSIPNDLEKEMRKKFRTYEHGYAFVVEHNLSKDSDESTCYILAGEVEILKDLQDYKNTIESSTEDKIEMNAEEFDFICGLKLDQIKANYPLVQCTLRSSQKFMIVLNGPHFQVEQVKKELVQFTNDLQVFPVDIDQNLVNHFAASEGLKQLKEYIESKECPTVPSFKCSSQPTPQTAASVMSLVNPQTADPVLSLILVCEPKHSKWAKSVAKDIKKEARCREVLVPENLSFSIDRLKEYQALISQLGKDYQTRIIYDDFKRTIFIFGFGEGVGSTVTNIQAFIEQKKLLSTPLAFSISQLLSKAFQKRPQALEQLLAEHNPNLIYSFSNEETEILVSSKVHIEEDWKPSLQTSVQTFLGMFSSLEVGFTRDAAQEISKFLADTEQSSSCPFAFDLQIENTLVEVAGDLKFITPIEKRIKEISSSLTIHTRKFPIQPALHAYLAQVQLEAIKTKHPDLIFTLDANFLLIQGPKAKVNEFFDEQLSVYLKFTAISVTTDSILVAFLSEGYGKEFLMTFLDSKQSIFLVATFQTPTIQLDFLCNEASQDTVRETVAELRSLLSVDKLTLPESLKNPEPQLKTRMTEFYKKIEKDHNVLCSLRLETIEFGGKKHDVESAIKEMDNFMTKECTTQKDLQLSGLQWKLIKKDEGWIREIKQYLYRVEVSDNGSHIAQVRVHLKGENSKVGLAHAKLLTLRDSLKMDSVFVLAPGACKFFQSKSTKTTILPGIESSYGVCIEIVLLDDAEPDVVENVDNTCSANEYCRVSTKFEKTNNIVTFKVHVGDLTEFETDVMVNPANSQLSHIGGLAAAIVKKGGPEIQKECSQYIRSKVFDLDEGDVYFSRVVGKLPCKAIVHAVGPKWQTHARDHKYERVKLRNAVTNSLAKAKRYSSIAFPAISSGVFHYPIDQCTLVHIEACVNFFKTTTTALKEVSFIVLDPSHAKAFQGALSQFFSGKVISLDLESSVYTIPDSLPSHKAATSATKSKTQLVKLKTSTFPCLIQGDLFSVKVVPDVYVCTANPSLDLSRGVIAQRMLKMAGPSLQKECTDKGNANFGDVVVTGPGNLKSQFVFHAVATNYNSDKDGKILLSLLQQCFDECEKHKVNSIAFPAIGPGGLGYPVQLVAKIMISESCKHLSRTTNPSFQIYLVIYDKSQYKAFQSELANVQTTSVSINNSVKRTESVVSKKLATSTSVTPEFSMNGIQVSVVKGDITKESSDAVVNTTGNEINLGNSGQVSKILLKIAGSKLQDLCTAAVKKEGKLVEGKVIHTQALKPLKCKSLFHIYFNSNDPAKFVETINACLVKAEQLQYTTIAFPAIGTGAQNYPTIEAARGFLAGIKQFSLSNPHHVKQIRIVIFNGAIYDEFLTATQPDAVRTRISSEEVLDIDKYPESESQFQDSSDSENFEELETSCYAHNPSTLSASSELASADDEDNFQTGLKLLICGFKETNVASAAERLNELMRENFEKDEIKDENIRGLKPAEHKEIQRECSEFGVECKIETDIGRIQLTGNVQDITKIKSKVFKIIHKVMTRKTEEHDKEMQHKYEVETVYHSIHWQYKKQDTTEFNDYDKEVSYAIEQAFQQYQKDKHRNIFHYKEDPYNLTFDFKKHEENDCVTKQKSRLRRFTNESGKRPDTWDEIPTHELVICIDLQPDNIEYKKALDAFNKTMVKGTSYSDIVKIQRIQNPRLYGLYQRAKEEMDRANPPGHPNERQLFHGTDSSSMEKINANGFNRSYAGKHAKAYGVGTYFALDASYSASPIYSQPDSKGHRHMYWARVLVGEYTVGSSSMMVPPAKDPQKNPNILFDSLVNNVANPTIFVVGPDAQSYPEYLIVFK